jgi:hypothetical protein
MRIAHWPNSVEAEGAAVLCMLRQLARQSLRNDVTAERQKLSSRWRSGRRRIRQVNQSAGLGVHPERPGGAVSFVINPHDHEVAGRHIATTSKLPVTGALHIPEELVLGRSTACRERRANHRRVKMGFFPNNEFETGSDYKFARRASLVAHLFLPSPSSSTKD